jgi:hypothetical protein
MESANDTENDDFPPEKRFEAPNHRLIKAGIATIPDMWIICTDRIDLS